MAATNSSGDGIHSTSGTLKQMYCSADLADETHHQMKFLAIINIILSITAFLGNTLILVSLRKESSLHPPSKLLLRSLATTDLCVGLISEPLQAMYDLSLLSKRWSICPFAFFASSMAGYTFSGVTLLTMTAISVDRLLALLLRLNYKQVVTLKRMYVVVIAFWVVSSVAAAAFILNFLITIWYSYIVVSLCLVISTSCYMKIFCFLCHHQHQAHPRQPNQSSPFDLARYKSAVSSALWLQFTLVVCYLPYTVVGIVGAMMPTATTPGELSSFMFLAKAFSVTLIYLNSSLNPILYCWKIGPVRQAVKDTIRQVLCY
ncbi:hypothetical protein ACROYT_G041883 [Oculina patagonica]